MTQKNAILKAAAIFNQTIARITSQADKDQKNGFDYEAASKANTALSFQHTMTEFVTAQIG